MRTAVPLLAAAVGTAADVKTTRFFLPPGKLVPLIQCDGLELQGSARPGMPTGELHGAASPTRASGGAPAGHWQGFHSFRVMRGDDEVAAVSALPGARLLPQEGSDYPNADAGEFVDLAVESDVPLPLTTVNVTVAGRAVKETGVFRPSRTTVSVVRHPMRQIGMGFSESVEIKAGAREYRVHSVLATKFPALADRVRNMHLDMNFDGDMSACTGPLTEIWGVHPMSRETQRLLHGADADSTA